MQKQSVWCGFFLLFGLTLAGIYTLGAWTRQAAAQPRATAAVIDPASVKGQTGADAKHWRSLVMQP